MTAVMCGAAGNMAAAEDRTDEIRLVSRTYSHTYVSKAPVSTSVTLTMNRDGNLVVTFPGGPGITVGTPNADEWHRDNTGATLGDDWDVRATVTSGTLTSGSQAWQRLNANRAWTVTETVQDTTQTATMTMDFRLNGGPGTILATITNVRIDAILISL